ncbi:hypothetical protein ACFQ0G_53595 [Streptomyces chiangmaiensis]|uniref:hypothetical protein n=1 Tax=Streptomyces chiangmaiensis TaxID=766497 RepID=UPI0031E94386
MQELLHGGDRHAVVIFGAVLMAAAVASCSSPPPAREYAIPKDLCGTEISSTLLEPLLPPGKEIGTRSTSYTVDVQRCRLQVDGKEAFSSSVERRGADVSARDVAMSAIGVEPGDTSTDNGRFIYSKTGAVGRIECKSSENSDRSVWVTARTSYASDASDMRQFIEQFAEAVGETGACHKS